MITVIGKLKDTKQYENREGFNVLKESPDWTPEKNKKFINDAIRRGDHLLFVSWKADGQYRQELFQLLEWMLYN